MKSIYKLWLFIACLTLVSCYDEDTITPTVFGDSGRFEFPQGDNSWDQDIVDIYEQFGIRFIYKDIIDKDFTKSWLSGTTSNKSFHGGGTINDDMTRFYITFMKEHVLQYLTPQITEKIFPMYWYLVFDFYSKTVYTETYTAYSQYKSHADLGMLDCWITCFWGQTVPANKTPQTAWLSPQAGDKTSYTRRRMIILNDVLVAAIGKGNIVMPAEFEVGLDFTTRLVTGETEVNKANANYYKTRAFPGRVNTSNGEYTKPLAAVTKAEQTFIYYLQLAMRYTQEELDELLSLADYPLMKGKFDFVQKYMKETYNIDLSAIANGPATWDITPYPEIPPAINP